MVALHHAAIRRLREGGLRVPLPVSLSVRLQQAKDAGHDWRQLRDVLLAEPRLAERLRAIGRQGGCRKSRELTLSAQMMLTEVAPLRLDHIQQLADDLAA